MLDNMKQRKKVKEIYIQGKRGFYCFCCKQLVMNRLNTAFFCKDCQRRTSYYFSRGFKKGSNAFLGYLRKRPAKFRIIARKEFLRFLKQNENKL